MTTFQFDQCFDDKKVIKNCNEEGLATAHRLPKELRGTEDPELLAVLMQRTAPLVTLDRALPAEHTKHIPEANPGIIVVNYSRDVLRTITTTAASKILAQFKEKVPSWHQLTLQNSIIEITEQSVEIWHIEGGELMEDVYIDIEKDQDWIDIFLQILETNARRSSQPPENRA